MSLTIREPEKLQKKYPDWHMELNNRNVFVLGDLLTIPDLFPQWQVSVSDLWAPKFARKAN